MNVEKRLRWAAIFVVLGLLVEAASLLWHHPLSFILFVGAGGTAMALGLGLFLHTALRARGPEDWKGAP